jgi:hypothetical protein
VRGSRAVLLLAASSLSGGFAAAGCTVGSGSGSAVGTLMDVGCNSAGAYSTLTPFSLSPTFFAGEPIEDVCPPPGNCSGPHMNRLVIRMQRTGNRIEVNDVLYFDVLNTLKVAECVRGAVVNGMPDWDTRLVTGSDGSLIPGLPWCDWNAADYVLTPDGGALDGGASDGGASDGGAPDAGVTVSDGGVPLVMTLPYARINLSTQDYVQASLAPLYTCVEARSVGVALPGSWIEFRDFGNAIENNVPPDQRGDLSQMGDYRVDFGQRLRANFHLLLGDQAVEHAIQTRERTPDLRIKGQLDGSFDFDLDRGRAAQPFP